MKIDAKHFIIPIIIFMASVMAAQWFSDNYYWDGFKIRKNDDED